MKVFFILTFVGLAFSGTSVSAAKSNVSTNGGRYQLIQLSDMRRDQFLIDTETGKFWSKTCAIPGETAGDCELSYWSEEFVLGKNVNIDQINSMIRQSNKDKSK